MSRHPLRHLPDPIGEILEEEEETGRYQALLTSAKRRQDGAGRKRRIWALGALGTAGIAAVTLVAFLASSPQGTPAPAATAESQAGSSAGSSARAEADPRAEPASKKAGTPALRLASAKPPGTARVQASERTRLVFEEGSSVTLEAGSTWHPGRNDGRAFESELVTGTARFQVTPGGPRTWIVRAGPMTVEVVGTRFAVQRNADRRAVRVEEGTVVVRDPRIPGGTRTLQAGEEVVLASSPTAAREAPRAEVVRSSARPKRERPDPRSDRSGWREAARRGDHARAYTLLGPASWERAVGKADAAELMQLADVARLSGHAERALEPLERLVDRYPSDPRAALAAVLAGRILMDQLHEPSRARPWLERALALGVGSALEPDVRDRLRSLGAPGSGSSP